MSELVTKYERFREQKNFDADPLIRWCPKPGCQTHVKAESKDTIKLTCPKCSTDVCFQCRDVWHGDKVSCAEAMMT